MTLEDAMSRAMPLVTAAGERLARVVELGALVGERRGARAEAAGTTEATAKATATAGARTTADVPARESVA
jgi:hypothetical protein